MTCPKAVLLLSNLLKSFTEHNIEKGCYDTLKLNKLTTFRLMNLHRAKLTGATLCSRASTCRVSMCQTVQTLLSIISRIMTAEESCDFTSADVTSPNIKYGRLVLNNTIRSKSGSQMIIRPSGDLSSMESYRRCRLIYFQTAKMLATKCSEPSVNSTLI